MKEEQNLSPTGGGESQNSEIYRHTGSKNSLTKVSRAKVIFLKVMKFY